MSARVVGLCVLLTLWLCSPAIVKAEEGPTPGKPGVPAPDEPVTQAQLKAALAELQNRLDSKLDALTKALTPPRGPTPGAPAQPAPTGEVTREEINDLWAVVNENTTCLGQIATKMSAPTGQDLYAINLDSLRNYLRTNEAAAEKMKEVVKGSLDRYGDLVVENRTGGDQYLWVNHTAYRIPVEGRKIRVPVGTVTTELRPYEGPKHLTVGAPTNVQRLVIGFPQSPAPSPIVDVIPSSGPWYWNYDPYTGTWWRRLP